MVKTYSAAKDGKKQLTPHFRVSEFACKDGTDKILIDTTGVNKLELIRLWAGASVNINSGYRTADHNRDVGGSPTSKHMQGRAWDIIIKGKTPTEAAKFAELIGFSGIEVNRDKNYLHVDTRTTARLMWVRTGGKNIYQTTFGGKCSYPVPKTSLSRGARGEAVKWVQFHLAAWGIYKGKTDGSFGAQTEDAVRNFQKLTGLAVDGHVGPATRKMLRGDV